MEVTEQKNVPRPKAAVILDCRHCKQPIQRRANEKLFEARRRRFCSRSCAASFHNRLPKRQRSFRPCRRCGDNVNDVPSQKRADRTYCVPCWEAVRRESGQRIKRDCTHAVIRGHARTIIGNLGKACAVCSYDLHVEACHIRPVAEFPPEATLAEINAPLNLVWLCPNHHWEFDHGWISRELVIKLRTAISPSQP
jgi:hypothetical protein